MQHLRNTNILTTTNNKVGTDAESSNALQDLVDILQQNYLSDSLIDQAGVARNSASNDNSSTLSQKTIAVRAVTQIKLVGK